MRLWIWYHNCLSLLHIQRDSKLSKTKVATIVGTRPEIIRMSEIIKKFDTHFDHRLIHTGQNSDTNLKDVFFTDLGLRLPDVIFKGEHLTLGSFLGSLFVNIEKEFIDNRPDAVVILGDTNSALSAILAKRFGIPIYHLEAGNRSFDANVPEEINRRIVDHTSDFNLVYTNLARNNLIAEGIPPRRLALTGTPLFEVFMVNKSKINDSTILETLQLKENGYFLVSAHRQENVDFSNRLDSLLDSLEALAEKYKLPVLISTHPRTKKKLQKHKVLSNPMLKFHEPFGFLDYVKLQSNARMVLSDSGSISEESAILGFPAITIRDSMERPEALEAGSIVMSGIEKNHLLEAVELVETSKLSPMIPAEYQIPDTSTRVVNFLISTVHQHAFWNGLHQN
jgi:UDP-N-acetylglucosamine 2-epimerase